MVNAESDSPEKLFRLYSAVGFYLPSEEARPVAIRIQIDGKEVFSHTYEEKSEQNKLGVPPQVSVSLIPGPHKITAEAETGSKKWRFEGQFEMPKDLEMFWGELFFHAFPPSHPKAQDEKSRFQFRTDREMIVYQ